MSVDSSINSNLTKPAQAAALLRELGDLNTKIQSNSLSPQQLIDYLPKLEDSDQKLAEFSLEFKVRVQKLEGSPEFQKYKSVKKELDQIDHEIDQLLNSQEVSAEGKPQTISMSQLKDKLKNIDPNLSPQEQKLHDLLQKKESLFPTQEAKEEFVLEHKNFEQVQKLQSIFKQVQEGRALGIELYKKCLQHKFVKLLQEGNAIVAPQLPIAETEAMLLLKKLKELKANVFLSDLDKNTIGLLIADVQKCMQLPSDDKAEFQEDSDINMKEYILGLPSLPTALQWTDHAEASAEEVSTKKGKEELSDGELNALLDPIYKFPDEVSLKFLSYLEGKDILNSQLVSKNWNRLGNDNTLWDALLEEGFHISAGPGESKKLYSTCNLAHQNILKARYAITKTLENGPQDITALPYIVQKCITANGGKQLICGYSGGKIDVWDLITGQQTLLVPYINSPDQMVGIPNFVLASNEKKLISANAIKDNAGLKIAITTWDLKEYKCEGSFDIKVEQMDESVYFTFGIPALCINKDGSLLFVIASHGNYCAVHVIDLKNKKSVKCLKHKEKHTAVHSHRSICQLSHDQKQLFVGYGNGSVGAWDLETEANILIHSGLNDITRTVVCALTLSPDAKLLIIGYGNRITILNLVTKEEKTIFLRMFPKNLSFHKDKLIAYSGRAIGVINLTTNSIEIEYAFKKEHRAHEMAFSPEGTVVLCSSHPNQIQVVDYTASHQTIFQELAALFRRGEVEEAMARFKKMPVEERGKIYGKMSVLKPSPNYWRSGEYYFHDEHGLSSTPQEKAQAIENYLNQN